MNEIAVHSEYVAAIATRNGQRMWAGRSVVSELLVTFRLTAFTSEVGESLRPLVAAWQVACAYAVSWTYVILDVALRSCDEYALRGRTLRILRTCVFFSLFHTIATMLLPAVLIHAAVHEADRLCKLALKRCAGLTLQNPERLLRFLRLTSKYGPSLVGLSLIPLMPLLDEPIEKVFEWAFKHAWPVRKGKGLSSKLQKRLTDYEIATMAEKEADEQRLEFSREAAEAASAYAKSQTPIPKRKWVKPASHEEPELQRATGLGEPTYNQGQDGSSSSSA